MSGGNDGRRHIYFIYHYRQRRHYRRPLLLFPDSPTGGGATAAAINAASGRHRLPITLSSDNFLISIIVSNRKTKRTDRLEASYVFGFSYYIHTHVPYGT